MKLYYLFKLARPVNLLIIAVTMAALRYLLMKPLLAEGGIKLIINHFDFLLLIVSTIMIAGAGNIINDYFDIKPDRVNKRHKLIVGKFIKRREAMAAHVIFSTLGFFIALYLAYKYHILWIVAFHIIAITLLWLYSASFKKSFLFGNIIVAFLTACIPLLVISFDIPAIVKADGFSFPYLKAPLGNFLEVIYISVTYAGFAFLLNLIREIQKDMADIKGDREIEARTMPIVLGIKNTKKVVNSLILFTILLIIYFQQAYLADKITTVYVLLFVILPMILSASKMKHARKSKQFLKVANYSKIAMGGGLGYLFLFYYIFTNHLW